VTVGLYFFRRLSVNLSTGVAMPFCFKSSHLASSISIMTLTVGLVFGQPTTQKSLAQTPTTTTTKINGAGATFPATLYQGLGWFNVYGVATPPAFNPPGPVNPNVQFSYVAIGSGAGIAAFLSQSPPTSGLTIVPPFSFGASDAPLNAAQLQQYQQQVQPTRGPLVQVPVVSGAVTLTYNTQSLNVPQDGLRLSRATYCGILNGAITNWNDPRITADNGGVQVSADLPLTVVRRSDGSGTNFNLSNHLNTVCQAPSVPSQFVWNRGVGVNSAAAPAPNPPAADTVYWPSTFLTGVGNPGVLRTINTTVGAIGYVDNGDRLQARKPAALLQNSSGNYIAPTSDSTAAAFTNATVPDSNIITVRITDPQDPQAYPIVLVTYLLFYGRYDDPAVAAGIKGFINWALAPETPTPPTQNPGGEAGGTPPPVSNPTSEANPNTIATTRGFAPLTPNLKAAVINAVNNNIAP